MSTVLRLEILDPRDRVLATHLLPEGLTTLGNGPGARVRLAGQGVGTLHLAIKNTRGKETVVMDLGGPSSLRVNGKESLEYRLEHGSKTAVTLLELGTSRLRLRAGHAGTLGVSAQAWNPPAPAADRKPVIRARVFVKGKPADVSCSEKAVFLPASFGLAAPFRVAWIRGGKARAKLPSQWIAAGGSIHGPEGTTGLESWSKPVALASGSVYRVQAGIYRLELHVGAPTDRVPLAPAGLLPRELRKPLAGAAAAVLALMAIVWLWPSPPQPEAAPEPIAAHIRDIPIEALPEPEHQEHADTPAAGGGSGGPKESAAESVGGAAAKAPSVAANLTAGLKNLIGGVLSSSRSAGLVVAETAGAAAAAGAVGGGSRATAALQGIGSIKALAGAGRIGKLAIAGSGQGFGGGSGVGLGTGRGKDTGAGIGDGKGSGGYRFIEEESIVEGGLDKSVIAAVIQNNLGQIKYCYERQLVAEPELFGKVVATWNINAAGAVENASIRQTTLASPPVERCILGKIARWVFPHPKNGTRVTVTYPFLFKSTR